MLKKYIFLDYENKWKNDVFRMFYYMANYFVTELNYILVDTSLYNSENKVSLKSLLNNVGDSSDNDTFSVLVVENHDGKLLPDFLTDYNSCNVNLYLLSDDIHKDKAKKYELQYYNIFKKIFVNYYKPFFEQYPEFANEKVIWTPHCVPEQMIVRYNEKPLIKIGLLGNTAGKVYPNRQFLKNLAANDIDLKDKIAEKSHPAKKYKPVDYGKPTLLVGQTYFSTLNRFLCNFTCSLTLGYAVCKYFEIAYTGSLLLCDATHDDLSTLGFIDMHTCIIYKDQSEIKEKVLWILNPANRKMVDTIRKNGMELVRERHMVSKRCNEINKEMDL